MEAAGHGGPRFGPLGHGVVGLGVVWRGLVSPGQIWFGLIAVGRGCGSPRQATVRQGWAWRGLLF
jgi:hypothetical protein